MNFGLKLFFIIPGINKNIELLSELYLQKGTKLSYATEVTELR
jgi:hypothetical protein